MTEYIFKARINSGVSDDVYEVDKYQFMILSERFDYSAYNLWVT